MSADVLKQNIEAMHRTQQLPSFVQVLFTFELALAEIERLTEENDELKSEVARLAISPT